MTTQIKPKTLYGQMCDIPAAEGGSRPLQREWAIKVATAVTFERWERQDLHALGIPYLRWRLNREMDARRDVWNRVPSPEGLRKRYQEIARAEFYDPRPLLHLFFAIEDIDPESTQSVYDRRPRLTSGYLVNPIWHLEQGHEDLYAVCRDFAFAFLGVSNFHDLNLRLLGQKEAALA